MSMTAADCEQFLIESTIPLRLACMDDQGFPRVISLWYLWSEGKLLSITHQNSRIMDWLVRGGKVGFEIAVNEPPYRGIRGTGRIDIQGQVSEELLEQLLARYEISANSQLGAMLRRRLEDECLLVIDPVTLTGWDYRERMADAV